MPEKQIFCREISIARAEQLPGTVGTKPAWLLLQDHSPWPAEAYAAIPLSAKVRDFLASFFGAQKPNIQLIRNSDAKHLDTRKAFVVCSGNDPAEIYEFEWSDPEDLLDLPLEEIARGRYQGRQCEPIFLVCTHGRRDKCCAKHGLPVYRHMRKHLGERVWRVSHIGGHRFAANMACLPHGIFYGRVTPESALALAQEYIQGYLGVDAMRGRSCFPAPVQAAEIFIRQRIGDAGVSTLRFQDARQLDESRHLVEFTHAGRRSVLQMEVGVDPSRQADFRSCDAEMAEHVPVFYPLRFSERPLSAKADVLPT